MIISQLDEKIPKLKKYTTLIIFVIHVIIYVIVTVVTQSFIWGILKKENKMKNFRWLLLGVIIALFGYATGYSMGPCDAQTRCYICATIALICGILITLLTKFLSK